MAQARPGVYLPKCQNANMFVLALTALTFVFHNISHVKTFPSSCLGPDCFKFFNCTPGRMSNFKPRGHSARQTSRV